MSCKMFSIFKNSKNSNIPKNVEEDVDDPIIPVVPNVSSKDNQNHKHNNLVDSITKKDSDLGNLETGPIRPILQTYPKTKFGSQSRSFSSESFNKYKWLEYSIKRNAAYCFPCRMFSNTILDDPWITTGFVNWHKLYERLKKHSSSKTHFTCVSKLNSQILSKTSGSVISQLSTAHQQEVKQNRQYVYYIIDIVIFLSKQGIAFRGHIEEANSLNQGNFKELCKLYVKSVPGFQEIHKSHVNYTSWKLQDEIIQLCANEINEIISN